METKITTHILKGLVLALVVIVLNVIGQLTKIYLETWFGWAVTLIFVAAIAGAVFVYGQQMENNVTFSNLFAHGFKASTVATCIIFIYTVLSVYVLFPEMINEVFEKGLAEARKNANVNEEQMQKGMEMAKKIIPISLLAGSIIANLIMGVVGALIGAAVSKKNPNPTPFV